MTTDSSSSTTTTTATTTNPPPQPLRTISYSNPPSRLRTLSIYQEPTAPNAPWLIYLHGGAWRDPTQDSHCIEPTLAHLRHQHTAALTQIAGIASLNYRLSPHATHSTQPSSPSDTERNVVHPTHIRDVAEGIRYLAAHEGMKRWIGVGHSCGATLLCQLAAGIGLEANAAREADSSSDAPLPGPQALLLLEGIYNIPLMLRNHMPPSTPAEIAQIYRDFVAGAFGKDKEDSEYLSVSPVAGRYDVKKWPEGRLVVVCHSYEDELVERAQRDVMCVALDRQGWSIVMEDGDEEDQVRPEARVLNVRDLKGGHDWVWEDGEQVAKLIAEMVQRLG